MKHELQTKEMANQRLGRTRKSAPASLNVRQVDMKLSISFLLITLLCSCRIVTENDTSYSYIEYFHALIERTETFINNNESYFPDKFYQNDPISDGDEFKICEYMSLFPHLKVKPGLVLDYIYHGKRTKFPIFYFRHTSEKRARNEAELKLRGDISSFSTMEHYESYFIYEYSADFILEYIVFQSLSGNIWLRGESYSGIVCIISHDNDVNKYITKHKGKRYEYGSEDNVKLLNWKPELHVSSDSIRLTYCIIVSESNIYKCNAVLNKSGKIEIKQSVVAAMPELIISEIYAEPPASGYVRFAAEPKR